MSTDTKTPEAPAGETPNTPFHKLGGDAVIAAIVNRFYDLMENDPAYAGLRAMHAADLAPMRKSLAGFLTGWSGGPRDWFDANPGRCMASMHKPFVITRELSGQWVEAMKRAIADSVPEGNPLGEQMASILGDLAMGMARPAHS